MNASERPRTAPQLVTKNELLRLLFSEEARPTRRWLEKRVAAGAIPRVKMGNRVWFDPVAVRAAIVAGQPPTSRA